MIAASLFSGIGAPETAMPDWQWPWHAEIDKFPAAVMAARHPDSINLGDVSAHDFADRAAAIARPNIIVFGSPCQSYSIAGKRLGLDDPRGNLTLAALAIVARLEPDWFVLENVPDFLSSWSGAADGPAHPGAEWEGVETSDFAAFLGQVDDIGYSLAWTVLDAQYAGVAQRRERLFALGYRGDWRPPAAVLFEPEGLSGHHPPRRQARQSIAGTLSACAGRRGGVGEADHGGLIATDRMVAFGEYVDDDTASTVLARDFKDATDLVAHALRAEGFDASEDGTGRGTPLVAFSCKDDGGDAVRRLTPRECERLQGFPDDYTLLDYRGKPAADRPRYKALGNSMAVPVMRWILSRIEQVDALVRAGGATDAA